MKCYNLQINAFNIYQLLASDRTFSFPVICFVYKSILVIILVVISSSSLLHVQCTLGWMDLNEMFVLLLNGGLLIQPVPTFRK